MPPYTITTKFNCAECQEDLTEVKISYGLITCPKCFCHYTVHCKPDSVLGNIINPNITLYLKWHHGTVGNTSYGTIPSDIKTGTYDKDGNFVSG